jgi:hypothetical protein
MAQEIVINRAHGGFGLSEKASEWLIENADWDVTCWEDGNYKNEDADLVDRKAGPDGETTLLGPRYTVVGKRSDPEFRSDPDLVRCVRALDDEADGPHASLEVVEIPEDVEYTIEEYDGYEWVAEKHRTWPNND